MTRLKAGDIEPIAGGLRAYDARLTLMIGASLREIACRAAGVDETLFRTLRSRVSFAAVPIRSGQGVIHGFSKAVAAILSHVGFRAFVTEEWDVAGMGEGLERGAQVLMAADDERFLALTPGGRHVVDNARATAEGYVVALELMKGSLEGQEVLVLGCGAVGRAAASALLGRGASVALCDREASRALSIAGELSRGGSQRLRVEQNPIDALGGYELIFDATNVGGFIGPGHLIPGTYVAAPGLPLALTPDAMDLHHDRVLHDVLEIGTATMAVQAAVQLAVTAERGRAQEG